MAPWSKKAETAHGSKTMKHQVLMLKTKTFSSNLFSYHPSFGAHSGSIGLHGATGSSSGSHGPWNFGAKVGRTSQLCVCKSMTCNHHLSTWGTCSRPSWNLSGSRLPGLHGQWCCLHSFGWFFGCLLWSHWLALHVLALLGHGALTWLKVGKG